MIRQRQHRKLPFQPNRRGLTLNRLGLVLDRPSILLEMPANSKWKFPRATDIPQAPPINCHRLALFNGHAGTARLPHHTNLFQPVIPTARGECLIDLSSDQPRRLQPDPLFSKRLPEDRSGLASYSRELRLVMMHWKRNPGVDASPVRSADLVIDYLTVWRHRLNPQLSRHGERNRRAAKPCCYVISGAGPHMCCGNTSVPKWDKWPIAR